MEKRSISTKVWIDDWFSSLSIKERYLWLYLISNDQVNMIGCYELPSKRIQADTGLSAKEIDDSLARFSIDGRAVFFHSWVRLIKFDGHNKFNSEKHQVMKDKLWSKVPVELQKIDSLSIAYRYPIDSHTTSPSPSTSPSNVGTSTKSLSSNTYDWFVDTPLEDLRKLQGDFPTKSVSQEIEKARDWIQSTGKKKKDYLAFFRNWLRNSEDKIRAPVLKQWVDPSRNEEGIQKFEEMKRKKLGEDNAR